MSSIYGSYLLSLFTVKENLTQSSVEKLGTVMGQREISYEIVRRHLDVLTP